MKIAIFYNQFTNPDNIKNANKIGKILKNKKIEYSINPEKNFFKNADIAISAGGDGTVLYTANLLAKYKIPILTINFGHKGYLCELTPRNLEEKIDFILNKKYKIQKRNRIEAIIQRQNGEITKLEALNEITIGGINRTVYLGLKITNKERDFLCNVTGDGIIISTETGSTAYNINAGGPMLLTEAFSLVANNAFFESPSILPQTKSIVLSTKSKIEVREKSNKKANLPYVIADGQKEEKISEKDKVFIKKSKYMNFFIIFS